MPGGGRWARRRWRAHGIATRTRWTRPRLAGTGKGELQDFVRGQVEAGAQLYSDEAAAYAGMEEFAHEAVKHSAGEYVRGQAHVNGLESFRALLKRGYHGTYHHMSPQHLLS